jgi:Mg-chelatase subunit ChlD
MIRTRLSPYLCLLLLLPLALLPAWVLAQSAAETAVNGLQIQEGNEFLGLDMYVILNGVAEGVVPQTAELLLDDGTRYPAQLSRPPFYVALALDVSGSMRSALPKAQETAVSLVQQSPPQTLFAVITFAEGVTLVQPFSDDHTQVIAAINSITIGESGTCLYDATFTAMQSLNLIAGETPRRALVLFTDGRDERQQGEGGSCSQYSLEDTLNYARGSAPLPIYIAALSGNSGGVDSATLNQMAAATDGQVAGEGQLPTLVQAALERINRQWLAQARLQPGQGERRGALFLSLSDQSRPAPLPVAFVASRSFAQATPSSIPPALALDGLTYDQAANAFRLDVAASSLPEGSSLRIDVINGDNLQVARLTLPSPIPPWQTARLDARPLTAGQAYNLILSALGPSGREVVDENGRSLTIVYPFAYNPPRPPELTIDGVQQLAEPAVFNFRTRRMEGGADLLQVNLHIENGEPVAQYEGRLISLQNNQQWGDPFTLAVVANLGSGKLVAQAPMALDNGTYTLVLNAVDEAGQRLDSARYTFSAPDTPPARAFRSAQANILLWLVGWAGFMMLTLLVWRAGLATGRRSGQPKKAPPPPAALIGPPPVRLEVLETPDLAFANGQSIVNVTGFPFTIGREGCNLNFAGDRHISRRHAQISYTNGVFYLTDFGSSNGTFINEARIEANKPTPLSSDIGAQIRLGKTTLLSFAEAEGNRE